MIQLHACDADAYEAALRHKATRAREVRGSIPEGSLVPPLQAAPAAAAAAEVPAAQLLVAAAVTAPVAMPMAADFPVVSSVQSMHSTASVREALKTKLCELLAVEPEDIPVRACC
jgi:hypothetical protein